MRLKRVLIGVVAVLLVASGTALALTKIEHGHSHNHLFATYCERNPYMGNAYTVTKYYRVWEHTYIHTYDDNYNFLGEQWTGDEYDTGRIEGPTYTSTYC